MVGFTVAVKAADACIPILQEAGVTDIEEFPSYEAVIDAAKNGDISLFVVDEPAALYYLYQKGIAKDFQIGQSLYSGQFHRAVKKGDAAMLALVKNGFARITSEELHKIDDKWFGRESSWLYFRYYLEYVLIAVAVVGAVILWVSLWNQRLRKEVRKKTQELVREKELLNITLQSIGDGVVATNTTVARTAVQGDRHAGEVGGLSGAPLMGQATLVLRRLRARLPESIPLVGVGGILSGADAVAKMAAGANLVQCYTGLVYRGPELIAECVDAMRRRKESPSGGTASRG